MGIIRIVFVHVEIAEAVQLHVPPWGIALGLMYVVA
jgi:hypothetical protein